MERETRARPAEGVRRDQAGAGLGVLGVDIRDRVGVVDVPELRRSARLDAARLKQRPHRAVAKDDAPAVEQVEQLFGAAAHPSSIPSSRSWG